MITKYRGYDIGPRRDDFYYVIRLDGVVQCAQPSIVFAEHWIDAEINYREDLASDGQPSREARNGATN